MIIPGITVIVISLAASAGTLLGLVAGIILALTVQGRKK